MVFLKAGHALFRTRHVSHHVPCAHSSRFLYRGISRLGRLLRWFCNKARPDTTGAGIYSFYSTAANSTYPLNIGLPYLFSFIVRVAHIVAYLATFSTDAADFSHMSYLQKIGGYVYLRI